MVVQHLDKVKVVGSTPTRTTIFLHPRSPLSYKNDDALNLNIQMMTYDDMSRVFVFYDNLQQITLDI